MKKCIFLSACFTLVALNLLKAEDAISTSEIARHLGIYYWRIPSSKLPPYYFISLRRIKDGRLTGAELLGGGFKNNGALLICARQTDKGIRVSADDDTMILATTVTLPEGMIFFLDPCQFTKDGVPFLLIAAQPPPHPKSKVGFTVAGYIPAPEDYTKAKDGFAMTINKDNTNTAEQGAAANP